MSLLEAAGTFSDSADYVLTVEADYNDADYITQRRRISGSDLRKFLTLLDRVPRDHWDRGVRWENGEYTRGHAPQDMGFTDEEQEFVDEYLPYMEDLGIHTITSIEFEPVPEAVVVVL